VEKDRILHPPITNWYSGLRELDRAAVNIPRFLDEWPEHAKGNPSSGLMIREDRDPP